MAWVSPTSSDEDPGWWDWPNAYDGNVATNAGTFLAGGGGYTPFCIFNHAALWCDSIRYNARYAAGAIEVIDVDVFYDGAFNDVYEGAFAHATYETKFIPAGTKLVTAVRVRFDVILGWTCMLYEIDFNEVAAPAVGKSSWEFRRSGLMTRARSKFFPDLTPG